MADRELAHTSVTTNLINQQLKGTEGSNVVLGGGLFLSELAEAETARLIQENGMRRPQISTRAKSRRWLQFSLRTLLVLSALVAVWLGVLVHRARQQRELVVAIHGLGGAVRYDYQRHGPTAEPHGPRWLREMIGNECFQTIVSINLRQKPANDQLLARIAGLHDLEYLDLGSSRITDDGVRHLRGLRILKTLDISFTAVSDRGLAELGPLPKLVYLDLSATSISDEGLRSLAHFKKLYTLSLFGTNITDRGLSALAEMESIGSLDLANTKITDKGLQELSRLPNLTRLRLDQVSYNPQDAVRVTDAGIEHVAKLAQLRDLGLGNLGLTDAGLAKLRVLKQLQSLDLFHFEPAFTAEGISQLQRELPTLTISAPTGWPRRAGSRGFRTMRSSRSPW